ncbi:MAG: hypothetical protein IT449_13690 [Phycisphaerales bacterium]|nr:hypothetical protein [Phycisphaerales bacterium]
MTTATCHRCGYDLTGLPVSHRCPECGMAFGALTRVWKPSEPWMPIVSAALLGYCIFSHGFRGLTPYRSVNVTISVAVIAGLVAVVIRMTLKYRRGIKLVVCADGVLVRDHQRNLWLTGPEVADVEIRSRRFQSDPPFVALVLRNGARIHLNRFFLWKTQIADFAASCDAARARRPPEGGETRMIAPQAGGEAS